MRNDMQDENHTGPRAGRVEEAASAPTDLDGSRLADLARASDLLGSSLDYEATLLALGDLVVPRFADWYAVDLVNGDGSVMNIAVKHADRAKIALALDLRRRFPPKPEDPTGVVAVARSGRSEWYREIPDEMLLGTTQDPDLLRILLGLGLRSAITVPLVAPGSTLGAITLISAESGRLYDETDLRFAEELGRRAGLAIANARLFSAEHEARARAEASEARLKALSATSRALAASLDLDVTLQKVANLGTDHLADAAVVYLAGDDGRLRSVAFAAREADRLEPLRRLEEVYEPSANPNSLVHLAYTTGRTQIRQTVDIESFASGAGPDAAAIMRGLRARSGMGLPLVIAGRRVGVLALSWTQEKAIGTEDVELAEEIARRMARAIENARLFAAERRARRRVATVSRASARLTESLDYGTSFQVLASLVLDEEIADFCLIDVLEDDGSIRRALAVHQDPAKAWLAEELFRRPPDPAGRIPVAVAMRTARRVESEVTDEVLGAIAPDDEHLDLMRHIGGKNFVAIPLVARGRVLGGVTLSSTTHLLSADDIELAEEIAARAAVVMDNARLLLAERRAAERLAMLARVSDLLAGSLDYPGAYERLGQLLVSGLADLCLIDLLDARGGISRLAAVHAEPAKQHLADILRERYPPVPGGPHPVARVVETGRPEFLPLMPTEFLRGTTQGDEHFRLVTELGFESFMSIPIQARGVILGALTLISTNPARRYGEGDLETATEIAARAALHLDNARLYAAQARAVRQASRLQRIVDTTFSSGSLGELLHQILGAIVRELGTDLAAILLMDEHQPVLHMRAAVGLEERILSTVAVPVGRGFAGRIAASRKPLVVGDVRSFDVVSTYLKERVHSIVGVPLLLNDEVIGVLHTGSITARAFDEDDVVLLQLAADRAAIAISRAELYEREHEISTILQRSLAPRALPSIPGIEVAVVFEATGRGVEVGGDFYDVFPIDGSTWGLVVGDVCGKGPEAAGVTALARNAIRTLSMREPSPGRILAGVSETMLRSGVDRFCTVAFVTFEPGASPAGLTFARGGHPPALLLRQDGSVEQFEPEGPLLGVFETPTFEEQRSELRPGDALLLFTDGLIERNPGLAGEHELVRLLSACAGMDAGSIAQRLRETLGGEAPTDDVVAVVVRRALPKG